MNINPDELESLDETLTESVPQTVAYGLSRVNR